MLQTLQYNTEHKLSYAEYGDKNGHPIFFHHGLIGSIKQPELEEVLAGRNIRLILTARPGYGESSPYVMQSYADWSHIIKLLAEKLDLKLFDVIGISAGAPYAYALGALMPEQVQGVFICSGLPAVYLDGIYETYPNPSQVKEFYGFFRTATHAEIAQTLHDLYIAPLPESVLATDDVQAVLAQNCLGMALECKLQSLAWGFDLADIGQSVVIQHSTTDEVVPFRAAQRTARHLKDHLFYVLDDMPHSSAELLHIFLQRVFQHINDR